MKYHTHQDMQMDSMSIICFGEVWSVLMTDGNHALVSRNASASAFGWEFQENAAIVLFIRNIADAVSIRVEGDEDIELLLDDGSKIYGQAKARSNNNPGSGSTKRFHDALSTLADDLKQANCGQLLYITNDEHPFGSSRSMAAFGDDAQLKYTELSDQIQEFVKQAALEKGIGEGDLARFGVCVIGFYGDDDNTRYKVVRRCIADFISKLKLNRIASVDDEALRAIWANQMHGNAATRDTSVVIEKAQFVWPIIVTICEANDDEKKFDDYEEELVSDVLRQYRAVITNNVERFAFVTRVNSDFQQFQATSIGKKRSEIRKAFIVENWASYLEELGLEDIDTETAELLVSLILSKVLLRSDTIERIKREVNL